MFFIFIPSRKKKNLFRSFLQNIESQIWHEFSFLTQKNQIPTKWKNQIEQPPNGFRIINSTIGSVHLIELFSFLFCLLCSKEKEIFKVDGWNGRVNLFRYKQSAPTNLKPPSSSYLRIFKYVDMSSTSTLQHDLFYFIIIGNMWILNSKYHWKNYYWYLKNLIV